MSDGTDGSERGGEPVDATGASLSLALGTVLCLSIGASLGLALVASPGLAPTATGLAPAAAGLGGPAVGAVGIVLAEAIALYVGYGVLARAVDPTVRDLLASD